MAGHFVNYGAVTFLPFLSEGNRKSFTSPKSSPVTMVWCWKLALVALMSLVCEYFGHVPAVSGPRTHVHVSH